MVPREQTRNHDLTELRDGCRGDAAAAFIPTDLVEVLMPSCAYCGGPMEPGHLASVASGFLVAFWAPAQEQDREHGLVSKRRWRGFIEFPGYHCPRCRTMLLYYSTPAGASSPNPDG